jgi:hypothetical protein
MKNLIQKAVWSSWGNLHGTQHPTGMIEVIGTTIGETIMAFNSNLR